MRRIIKWMRSDRHEARTTQGEGEPAAPRILLVGDPPSRTGIAGEFRASLAARAGSRGWQFEEIVIDEAALKPCTGCLTCYLSNGGDCIFPDGYPPLRDKARRADCVVLLTEITFGQASVAIKQAIDKGIGCPWGFCGPFPAQLIVGYGRNPGGDEASCFLDIVRRHSGKAEELHRPLKACVTEAQTISEQRDIGQALAVLERMVESPLAGAMRRPGQGGYESAPEWPPLVRAPGASRRVCLLNGSLRGSASTSHFLLNALEARLGVGLVQVQRMDLSLGTLTAGLDERADRILACDALVVALPVFSYCVPAGLLKLLVELRRRSPSGRPLEFFAIVYSGGPMPHISTETIRVLRRFVDESSWRWGGSLVVGGGLLFKKAERFPFFGRRLERPLAAMAGAVRGDLGAGREDFSVWPPIPLFMASLIRNALDRSAVRKAEREKRAVLGREMGRGIVART
jgi:multimeric flavodoxin WrbA